MMDNDISPDHFDWLVECRSINQKTTVKLYTILKESEAKLNRFPELQVIAQSLAGAAFSLWRAVFLCDVSEDTERRSADLNTFLVSLIADNIVLYQTDKNSRNWSFRYYLENAETRLGNLADTSGEITTLVSKAAASEKERWCNVQTALDCAIRDFKGSVDAAPEISN